jgi:deazaflavin-dependent oxidoreductase (nitroreductase family)
VPLPLALARFNRRVTNKVLGHLAGVTPPFAIVVHVGRTSGRSYRTPVWAFRTERGFVVALTYGGTRTEWVKNVTANGGAKLVTRDGSHDAVHLRVIHGREGIRYMPPLIRPALHVLRVHDYLLIDTGDTEPTPLSPGGPPNP